MRLTVLGASAAWPSADQACGGYVVEHDGYRLLIDPGYATFTQLQREFGVDRLDAVLISHAHPDHCADLGPLLRARVLGEQRLEPLPVFAPAGALDALLKVDQVRSVRRGAELVILGDGSEVELGPFVITTVLLPHHVPNLGMHIANGSAALAYTGDSGDCDDRVSLAKGADLLLAEATYPEMVPPLDAPYLSSARQVARQAQAAEVASTVLTHLWPGSESERVLAAAVSEGLEDVQVARAGLILEIERAQEPPPARRSAGFGDSPEPVEATARPRRAQGR